MTKNNDCFSSDYELLLEDNKILEKEFDDYKSKTYNKRKHLLNLLRKYRAENKRYSAIINDCREVISLQQDAINSYEEIITPEQIKQLN